MISPTALIVKLRELSETQPYVADYVSGPGLAWRRLSSAELLAFPFYRFLHHGESPRELEMKVGSFLSDASGVKLKSSGPVTSRSFFGVLRMARQAPSPYLYVGWQLRFGHRQ